LIVDIDWLKSLLINYKRILRDTSPSTIKSLLESVKGTLINFAGRLRSTLIGVGKFVAIRRKKRQLQAVIRGWGRWYLVKSVTIEDWLAGVIPCT
jgi:hypothetical protein